MTSRDVSSENPFPGPSTTGIVPPANGGANEKSPDDACDLSATGAGETNGATFEPSPTGAAACPAGAAATGSIPPAKSTTTNTDNTEQRILRMDPPAPDISPKRSRTSTGRSFSAHRFIGKFHREAEKSVERSTCSARGARAAVLDLRRGFTGAGLIQRCSPRSTQPLTCRASRTADIARHAPRRPSNEPLKRSNPKAKAADPRHVRGTAMTSGHQRHRLRDGFAFVRRRTISARNSSNDSGTGSRGAGRGT